MNMDNVVGYGWFPAFAGMTVNGAGNDGQTKLFWGGWGV